MAPFPRVRAADLSLSAAEPRRWRSFPLAVGVFAVPGIMIGGGILSELNGRLLEIPLVAFALGWIVIGSLIWPTDQGDA